ncbi:MAG: ABC transporter substrate-binding protein [Nanoarchaeota archaeon]|nr:ABC transporter substrate-binding protein [Nanoarchaeota archaeon]
MKTEIIWTVLLALLIFSIGCQNQKTDDKLIPVEVQLKWVHQAQFTGNYVANDIGFYEKYGIEIENFEEFDFTNFPIEMVQNKEVEFGLTGAEELLIAKANGKADDVKAIAVIYKISPVCLYSLKESGITKPEDLVGKTVGIERAADGTEVNVGIIYQAMLGKLGIDRDSINEVTIGYDAAELLAGETDVSTGYVINEPHQAIEAGHEVNIILPAEYGVNIYGDIIIVHEDTINNDPDLVEAFLRATFEGWQYSIEHEEQAVDIVLKYAVDRTKAHETYMLKQTIPLIHTGDSQFGMMEQKEWQNAQDILLEQGIIKNSVDLNNVYTMEFLEKIYGKK